jgi:hypothetical protein
MLPLQRRSDRCEEPDMDIPVPSIFQSLASYLSRHDRTHRADVRRAAAVQVVSLPMNGTVSVERPQACRGQCVRGSVWITHIGDGRDVVVEAGTTFVGDRDAPMFIQALAPTEFIVTGAQPMAD